jgi:hypothetical protein
MAIRILPFRQYDENDVINMFAWDGTVNGKPSDTSSDAGVLVSVASGDVTGGYNPTVLSKNDALLGPSDYPHVARNYYPEVPLKVDACSTTKPEDALGITLAQTLTHDENDENLLRYPQKKAELFAVSPGEAVPVATKGIFTLSEAAFHNGTIDGAHKSIKASTNTAGMLETEANATSASIGKILVVGVRASQNGNADQFAGKYAVIKLDC